MNKSNSGKKIQMDTLKTAVYPLFATLLALIIGGAIIASIGENPFSVYAAMFTKSFFEPYYLLQTFVRSAPIMLAAAAAAVAWRAGYINLGMEGQMAVGGLVATVVGLFFPVQNVLTTILAFAAGMAAGALYALLPTYLDSRCGAPLVITTLMLNYAANSITNYFAAYPLKDQSAGSLALQTPKLSQSVVLTTFSPRSTFNTGFFIAILAMLLLLFVFKKTTFGYESKMTGLNPRFAEYGGIKSKKIMYKTMALSGAVAGLAACIEIYGVRHRFISDMFSSTSYAWTGLMACLISSYDPVQMIIYSIFLSGLSIGGQSLQRTMGLPMQIADIIQCCITLFVSVKISFDFIKNFKKKSNDVAANKEGGSGK